MEQTWKEQENWECLKRFFPDGWEQAALACGVWQRPSRSIVSSEALLRLLLIHLADGCSLRETVVRAREGRLADISDVALLKRLQASAEWLRWMAIKLLERRGVACAPPSWLSGYNVRAVDASVVCEPGSTGTDWRVHYSLCLFDLHCDEFHLTDPKVGETFSRFHVAPGDLMMGDRAYGQMKGIRYVLKNKGQFLTRIRNRALTLVNQEGAECSLSKMLFPLGIGDVGHWGLKARAKGHDDVPLRLCAMRMSETAAAMAIRKTTRYHSRKQRTLDPETLALHQYIVLVTSLPESISARQVLELYRARWQIELAFKRLKSIMGLGHLPKTDEHSAKAWLHGKLFVAFLAQALVDEGRLFSPWGYPV